MKKVLGLICLIVIAVNISLPQIPTEGLVAWYPFNGDTIDASGNGYNISNFGATLTTDRFGRNDSAYDFNGLSAYMLIPDTSKNLTFDAKTDSYTISMWVYFSSMPERHIHVIMDKVDNGPYSYYLNLVGNTKKMIFGPNDGTNDLNLKEGSTIYETYRWYHLVEVTSDSVMKLYVNGVLDDSINIPMSFGSSKRTTDAVAIGTYFNSPSQPVDKMTGKIDDICIYNRALSELEIDSIYHDDGWPVVQGIPCPGIPTVDYMGKTYNTVLIGSQCWLKENLDVGTTIYPFQNQTDNGTIEKYCYNHDTNNCNTYGGLYQWNEAMQYSTTPGTQGLCPSGWHIPTYSEFQTLKTTVGSDGNALKEIGQGSGAGAGTNTSGFSALLAGFRYIVDYFYYYLGEYAYFWSSTEYEAYTSDAWYISLYHTTSTLYDWVNNDKKYGFSVRCLKDEAPLPIQLGSFIVIPNPVGDGIKLEWSTISEVNNYGFYIERKSDIEQNFTEILNSFIAGHGTTTEMQEYSFVDNTLTIPGIYHYRLRQVDNDGLVNYSQVVSINTTSLMVNEIAPIEFKVQQNYPNPSNPKTTIKFSVDKVEHATVIIYDVLGKEVAELFDGITQPGRYYSIEFDGSSLSSGIYFYKVSTESHSEMRKLVLLK
jgi:uncharacterized protein (TIGR02145 family)